MNNNWTFAGTLYRFINWTCYPEENVSTDDHSFCGRNNDMTSQQGQPITPLQILSMISVVVHQPVLRELGTIKTYHVDGQYHTIINLHSMKCFKGHKLIQTKGRTLNNWGRFGLIIQSWCCSEFWLWLNTGQRIWIWPGFKCPLIHEWVHSQPTPAFLLLNSTLRFDPVDDNRYCHH